METAAAVPSPTQRRVLTALKRRGEATADELATERGGHRSSRSRRGGPINLHSCAIWPVACKYRQACTAELEFVQDLIPEGTVERVTHKTAGAHTCAYDITIPS